MKRRYCHLHEKPSYYGEFSTYYGGDFSCVNDMLRFDKSIPTLYNPRGNAIPDSSTVERLTVNQ
jgi:hypothetical protein